MNFLKPNLILYLTKQCLLLEHLISLFESSNFCIDWTFYRFCLGYQFLEFNLFLIIFEIFDNIRNFEIHSTFVVNCWSNVHTFMHGYLWYTGYQRPDKYINQNEALLYSYTKQLNTSLC